VAELVFAGTVGVAWRETGPVLEGITSRSPIGHRRPGGHVIPDAVPAGTVHRMRVSLAGRHVSVYALAT